MRKTYKKGFTLVELVIVIAVIAILSAVLIPSIGGIVADAKKTTAKNNLLTLITTTVTESETDLPEQYFIYAEENEIKSVYRWTGNELIEEELNKDFEWVPPHLDDGYSKEKIFDISSIDSEIKFKANPKMTMVYQWQKLSGSDSYYNLIKVREEPATNNIDENNPTGGAFNGTST